MSLDPDDSQDSVSMVEVLKEEQQREEDANAVLGGSDDNHCTYPQGPLPRQALYSCVTCVSDDQDPAGVCLACSLDCHEGHDLYELYTKRDFRCDCGNSKFGNRKCKLWPQKEKVNPDNKYNQNFRGLYCTCHRPYPDDEIDDEMIQCIICEDWFHTQHLKSRVPPGQNYEEMTCFLCVHKHPFLRYYQHLQVLVDEGVVMKVTHFKKNENSKGDINVESPKSEKQLLVDAKASDNSGMSGQNDQKNSESTTQKNGIDGEAAKEEEEEEDEKPSTSKSHLESRSLITMTSSDSTDSEEGVFCLLHQLKQNMACEGDTRSLFWRRDWRNELCTCDKCMTLYTDSHLPYILDDTDTITRYEAQGRSDTSPQSSQYERGMEALSNMNRVTQVEMISGYNDLKTELTDYLKKFADNGKVVREEDIKEFFSNLSSRKRQRTEIPYHCK